MPNFIAVDDINDGMVAADPIVNNFGQTLIPAGATLKESHKKLLKTWNISSVSVQGDDSDDKFEMTEEMRQLATEKLLKRLQWEPANEFEKDIYQLGLIRTANNIMKQK